MFVDGIVRIVEIVEIKESHSDDCIKFSQQICGLTRVALLTLCSESTLWRVSVRGAAEFNFHTISRGLRSRLLEKKEKEEKRRSTIGGLHGTYLFACANSFGLAVSCASRFLRYFLSALMHSLTHDCTYCVINSASKNYFLDLS